MIRSRKLRTFLEVRWGRVIGINLDSGEFSKADLRIHDLKEIELKLIYDSYELRL